jgi:hypothetical protein
VVRDQDVARRRPWPKILAHRAHARLRAMLHAGDLERELQQARMREAGLAAERDAYLRQRDEAIGERNEFLRQRDEALAAGDRMAAHMAHLQAGARARLRPAHLRSPQN